MASIKPLNYNGKIAVERFTLEYFRKSISEARNSLGKSISEFNFNKTRCRLLSKCEQVKADCQGILYWMNRDCRVQDNWAMLFAQRLALKYQLPLNVCFFCADINDLYPTSRQFTFLINGLTHVEKECKELNIGFFLINSTPLDLPTIVKNNNIGCIVTEFSPLRKFIKYKETIVKDLPADVSLVEVDSHNIVPTWIASNKQEIAARTIRPKITQKLSEYLTGFPPVCYHHYCQNLSLDNQVKNFDKAIQDFQADTSVEPVSWAESGSAAALETLRTFITNRIHIYEECRNDPTKNAVSNLSPWLHFGQISAERCALEVKTLKNINTDSFLEELIIRKELSDNYCYYNSNYDNFEGAPDWAQKTLNAHRKDKRAYVYTKEQFSNAETHDNIWNSAQLQLVHEGKMHGYMRMYWCKKILEWTNSPEEAIHTALWLNDTFSLDGSDPNGYVGVMWSICGVHDHAWKEREIFGKIRFMIDYSLQNKFDMAIYCAQYGKPSNKPIKKRRKRKID